MPVAISTVLIFAAAAVAEIAGCFAFWAWLRQGKSILWLAPGLISLVLFAYFLTLVPSDHAGRAYAAYTLSPRCYGSGLPKDTVRIAGTSPVVRSPWWPR
jgi:hypothetical protein